MTDDMTKEQNVDPITGKPFDEELERRRLQDITFERPEDIREKFDKFTESSVVLSKSIEHQLVVKKYPDGTIYREYYSNPSPDSDFSVNDIRHEASFIPQGNTYLPSRLHHNGEKNTVYSTEEFTVWLNDPLFKGHKIINPGETQVGYGIFTAEDEYREILVSYDANNKLTHLLFQGSTGQQYILLSGRDENKQVLDTRPYFRTIEEFIEKGSLEVGNKDDSIQAGYDNENKAINIRRTILGQLKDELVIPFTIDREAVIDKLFPSPYFDNPSKTDPKEDISWKTANLATFGIKWDRY